MNAIIMAGGEGSRLRPLTCDKPKPMMTLCGKPILEYILDLLIKHGVESSTVTVKYLSNIITEHFENGEYNGHKINFARETQPLGTAGGVKNALKNQNDTFIVISGDAMCDFDLTRAVKFHKSRNAAVTILTAKVNDPREYGLVCADDSGKINGFIEKPGWGQSVCRSANTGIYIVEPQCMELVPDSKPFDFAKDLFPLLLKNGFPVYSCECEGYWCDIGNIEAYLKCQRDMLNNRIRCNMPGAYAKGIFACEGLPKGEYKIIPPVYIGKNVKISDGAVIGPESVVEDGCKIMPNARVRYSVLGRGSTVGSNACLTGSVTADGVCIKNDVSMFEASAAGASAVLGRGSTVSSSVLIWPGKILPDGSNVRENVKYGTYKNGVFSDEGAYGDIGIELTAQNVARLGSAVGSCNKGARIAVASCDGAVAQSLKYAVMSGLMSSGMQIWDFGECPQSELKFLTAFCGLTMGIYICNKSSDSIKIYGEYGLGLPRYTEREIESSYIKGSFDVCAPEDYKKSYDMSSMHYAYESALLNAAGGKLGCVSASVKSKNEAVGEMLTASIEKLGGKTNGKTLFRVSPSGLTVSARTEDGERIAFERLLAVCCHDEMKNGRDVTLPYDCPQAIEALAVKYGRKVQKYLNCPCDKGDITARKESVRYQWASDGLLMTMKVLGIMERRGMSLKELSDEIPRFAVYKKTFSLEQIKPCGLSEIFGTGGDGVSSGKEGITLKMENGRTFIFPNRLGTKIKVIAEALNSETAKELCFEINTKLKNASLDIEGNKE